MDTILTQLPANDQGPKYKAVAGAIRSAVQSGKLTVGEKLPPVRELAWSLKITPGTVARAYTLLTNEGVLEAAVGRGTFVAATRNATSHPPIEVDAALHGSGTGTWPVNLYSPALPNLGQAGLIRRLMIEVAQDPPSGLMHYPSRAGFRRARQAVVQWLERTPLGALDQEDIVLSHGAQNGMTLILQAVLKGPRPVVLIEELAYPGFRRAAELLRAEAVPVPVDGNGIIPEALAEAASRYQAQALLTSPEVQNPTMAFTPQERREDIVKIARMHNFQIVEDDCYRMSFSQAPCYRMLAPELGWYVSSISKILTPSLRIGYAVAPKGQVAALRRAAEHGFFGLATPLADLAERLLTAPEVHDIADAVRIEMRDFIQIAVNTLGAYDLSWRRDVPFLWLRLPRGWRASAFCVAAEGKGVRVRPAEDFASRDARAPHAVRIAVNAQIGRSAFEHAMEVLRDLLDNPPDSITT